MKKSAGLSRIANETRLLLPRSVRELLAPSRARLKRRRHNSEDLFAVQPLARINMKSECRLEKRLSH